MNKFNTKTMTSIQLVQWGQYQNVRMKMTGSVLFEGANGSGKSQAIDAMMYALYSNKQFNKAADDKDRTVKSYVRGDTTYDGADKYLRSGEITSYIAVEFWDPSIRSEMVIGVCMESPNETSVKSSWFICRDTKLDQMNFTEEENGVLKITPKLELAAKGKRMKTSEFIPQEKAIEQIARALGYRTDIRKLRSKLLKMAAFKPEGNVEKILKESFLEPGEVKSLSALREQMTQHENLKAFYLSLLESKEQLHVVNKKADEYEKKTKSLYIREMMFVYQQKCQIEDTIVKTSQQLEALRHKKDTLLKKRNELNKRSLDAEERYRIARNNTTYNDMQNSIRTLESEKEKVERQAIIHKQELAKLKKQQSSIEGLFSWITNFIDITRDEKSYLCGLAKIDYDENKKVEIFLQFAKKIKNQSRIFEKKQVHLEDEIDEIKNSIEEISKRIKLLESNRIVLPAKVEKAKQIISEEFKKNGIKTEVRTFAELVQEVKMPEWRYAIETYLGNKRFNIVIESKYCEQAIEILEKRSIFNVNIVLTSKLPDTKIGKNSAAEMLLIPNVDCRKYANYLLNGIHLCSSLEELYDHPKGGLMMNGMLAKSYSVSYMDITKTVVCFGADAIIEQLKIAEKELDDNKNILLAKENELIKISGYRKQIDAINWNVSDYNFNAATELSIDDQRIKEIEKTIEEMTNDPSYLTIINEIEAARLAYENVKNEIESVVAEIGGCDNEIKTKNTMRDNYEEDLAEVNESYSEIRAAHLSLETVMIEEYNRLHKLRPDSFIVISEKTVKNLRGEAQETKRQLETSQLAYCKLKGDDINKRGPAYIPYYRKELTNISNIAAEEARERLDVQRKKVESAFMNDFVAELNESINETRSEIISLNKILRKMPFGKDIYQFRMDEKPERQIFFKICKKLNQYIDAPDMFMRTIQDDEEFEYDMKVFMDQIINEDDESEYTDYRNYFTYNMDIINYEDGKMHKTTLSKKYGSASGGEKQTPYYLIMAAALMQYYPPDICCARLAFIDEAFAHISPERAEQLIRLFKENDFQVIFAAPEKVGNIGKHVETTIALTVKDRHTLVVEGIENA